MVPEDATGSSPNNAFDVQRPAYLHEKEVQDAVRVISLIAAGRNPFSEEPFDKLRPEQRDSILQALCIVVSSLSQSKQSDSPDTESWAPSGNSAKSMSK